MNPHILRAKMRRQLEAVLNGLTRKAQSHLGESEIKFHLKYTKHFMDDLIDRKISVDEVYALFVKSFDKIHEYSEYLNLPYRPYVDEEIVSGVEYRPTRLEVSDGDIWVGLTSDKPLIYEENRNIGLTCRMAIRNPSRKPSRVSTKTIMVPK